MILNFTMIGDSGGKDFDSKPAKTPDGVHRSETWLKNQHKNSICIVDNFWGLMEYEYKMKAFKKFR